MTTRAFFRRAFLTGLALTGGTAGAAGLSVSEARPAPAKGGVQLVRCDVEWDASWRNDLPGEGRCNPGNYDAAWVFAKYREGDGPWKPATLGAKAGDHVAPPGAAVSVGQTGGKPVGVFVYRAANGMGRFAANDLGLSWSRAADGVGDGVAAAVKVFALEMVHVPQGAFWAGDGLEDGAQFCDGGDRRRPFRIAGEGELAVGPAAGSLHYGKAGDWSGDQSGALPAAFPKGFGAFYAMKYELNQAEYAGYLGTLTAKAADVRWDSWWASFANGAWAEQARKSGIRKAHGGYESNMPQKACGFLRWSDQAAYLDWAGLRPMTELEFEKACRGPLAPVPGEFAWGDARAVEVESLADEGTAEERPNNAEKANIALSKCELMRAGCLGVGTGVRSRMGAGYYGMMELSGNQLEPAVSAGSAKGREFTGRHGDGALSEDGQADVASWPGADARGIGWRGGGGGWAGRLDGARVSDRKAAALGGAGDTDGHYLYGVRGVRTAPEVAGGTAAATASGGGGGPKEGSVVGGEARPAADGVALSADRQVLVLPKGKRVRVSGMTAKGGAPAAATEVTASWDDEGMTVVFDCADTNLVSTWAEARDSEKTWKDDSVAVLLDLGHRHGEGENFVMFKLSAAGGLQDCRGKSRDIAFTVPGVTSAIELPAVALDAWQIMPPTAEQQRAAASTVPEGHWRGTIRIPWQGLGAKPAEDEVWGVNFTRIDQPGMTFMAWAPFDEQFEELRSFGHLVFAAADAAADAKAAAARRESVKLAHARLAADYLNEGVTASVSRARPAVIGEWGVIKTGARPKQATTASLAWGDGGLEVVFDCTDDGVVAAQEGRDNIKLWKDDSVYLFLDTGHTHNAEQCWMIQVSASGACLDQRNNDPKADVPGVTVKTERTDKGWRAHLGIPWQGLGAGAPKAGAVWGLNLARMDQPGKLDFQNMETSSWAPLPEGDVSVFDRWGHLVFVTEGEGAEAERDAAARAVKAAHDGRWQQMGPKPLD